MLRKFHIQCGGWCSWIQKHPAPYFKNFQSFFGLCYWSCTPFISISMGQMNPPKETSDLWNEIDCDLGFKSQMKQVRSLSWSYLPFQKPFQQVYHSSSVIKLNKESILINIHEHSNQLSFITRFSMMSAQWFDFKGLDDIIQLDFNPLLLEDLWFTLAQNLGSIDMMQFCQGDYKETAIYPHDNRNPQMVAELMFQRQITKGKGFETGWAGKPVVLWATRFHWTILPNF